MIAGGACQRPLARSALLERVVPTSDLNDSIGKTGAQCFVKSSSVMTAASVLVSDDGEEVYCASREKRAKEE